MKESTKDNVSETIDDLRALVRDAEKLLGDSGDAAGEKITELRERMRSALESSRGAFERVRVQATEQVDRCDEYVRAHPYHSIGVAVAVGTALGLLLSRRS